jgi:hypothetical protein
VNSLSGPRIQRYVVEVGIEFESDFSDPEATRAKAESVVRIGLLYYARDGQKSPSTFKEVTTTVFGAKEMKKGINLRTYRMKN